LIDSAVARTARTWAAALLALLASIAPAGSLAGSPSADDAYLDGLNGHWTMTGTFGGKPVTYDAAGTRVLDGAWMKLHMVDTGKPPQYQADVFIGYDAKAGDFIAHWLDRFGAAGARIVATGHREGSRLVLLFPYSDGLFRDTFQRNAQADTWTLLIESQGRDGVWSTFARYELTRSKP
jgi:hypothetical protein